MLEDQGPEKKLMSSKLMVHKTSLKFALAQT